MSPQAGRILDAYINAAVWAVAARGSCTVMGKTAKRSGRPMFGAWCADAGIETAMGCHTSTWTTDYLTNGRPIELAQRTPGHSSAEITGLYERRTSAWAKSIRSGI